VQDDLLVALFRTKAPISVAATTLFDSA
jgi:hypothetical protein